MSTLKKAIEMAASLLSYRPTLQTDRDAELQLRAGAYLAGGPELGAADIAALAEVEGLDEGERDVLVEAATEAVRAVYLADARALVEAMGKGEAIVGDSVDEIRQGEHDVWATRDPDGDVWCMRTDWNESAGITTDEDAADRIARMAYRSDRQHGASLSDCAAGLWYLSAVKQTGTLA